MKIRNLAIVASAVVLLASCGTPQNVVYFQDSADQDVHMSVNPQQIRLRPEDKISIIVNCPGVELMNQFNLPYVSQYLGAQTENYGAGNRGVSGYTIDSDGNIDFPVLGKVHVAGLTRTEVAELIKHELQSRDLVKDPVITVDYMNLYVSLMGEVTRPGRYAIARDHFTVLDAIAMAGDLTIDGRRDNVRVIREEDGVQRTFLVDLRSTEELVKSPAYYLNQNDIIYVEPTVKKTRQSTVNGNTVMSASFWVSMASLAASLASTITLVAIRVQDLKD